MRWKKKYCIGRSPPGSSAGRNAHRPSRDECSGRSPGFQGARALVRRGGVARTRNGKLCLAFPDAYTLGMSHHGLQVLYTIMNNDPQWACERCFTPWVDFEDLLRRQRLPLYSLETFTPLHRFDLIGFSLQYEICYTN